ncbi:hypothetical protein [Nocardia paucivorans]|uniref:hypothetical protein n=1 Tax=Nocardia paucivorans TaxID=114259 RepID=UPI0003035577|nr:hypothetical protein [Nocardia paucivorans]
MLIILGLVVTVAAVAAGVAGVAVNTSEINQLDSEFSVFDYTFAGTTGELFIIGLIVGVVGGLGVSMLFAGVRRSTRKRVETRRDLANQQEPVAAGTGTREPVWSMNRFLRRSNKGTPRGAATAE